MQMTSAKTKGENEIKIGEKKCLHARGFISPWFGSAIPLPRFNPTGASFASLSKPVWIQKIRNGAVDARRERNRGERERVGAGMNEKARALSF